MSTVTITEREGFRLSGYLMLLLALALLGGGIGAIVVGAREGASPEPIFFVGLGLVVIFGLSCAGFYTCQPGEARALTLFGAYTGTVREAGFWWSNPFALKKPISLRARNFASERLKVNDAAGNPVEIAAVIVWSVVDSARALFQVERYENFVNVQAETAVRALASHFPYDSHDEGRPSLRGSPDEVAVGLAGELQGRLEQAGVHVHEARISHLAYAPEIAQAMLRRQQAQAVIAARQQIVEGAVSMVEMALRRLEEHGVVALDEERKAAMVSNLLVVLVSESEAQPVVNAGTLYA
jgi:regulator of protease activity HflC (stomatin/prohibitin superfamily)